jgi:hypothetical protein
VIPFPITSKWNNPVHLSHFFQQRLAGEREGKKNLEKNSWLNKGGWWEQPKNNGLKFCCCADSINNVDDFPRKLLR